MIELYLRQNTEQQTAREERNYCVVMNYSSYQQLEKDVGNLIVGAIKSGSLTDPEAAGKLFLMMMDAIYRRSKGTAGDVFSCGNTLVVSRKNFVAGVDDEGFYTNDSRSSGGKKFRKLELDDIKDVSVDNKPPEDEEVPF